jgi:hypothetical protein
MLSPIFSILSACCIPVHLISYGMWNYKRY